MTKALAILLLVAAFTAAANADGQALAPPASVKIMPDKFTGQTTVELKPMYVYKDKGFMAVNFDVMISLFFRSQGSEVSRPDSLTFCFVRGAGVRHGVANSEADWRFSRESTHDLVVICDEIRTDLGKMRYLRGPEASTFLEEARLSNAGKWIAPEVLAITLPTDQMLHLIDATSTEGRVDGLPFFLQNTRQGNLEKYRAFASYVRELPSPPAAAE